MLGEKDKLGARNDGSKPGMDISKNGGEDISIRGNHMS